jgi:hypothetical protein
MSGLPVSNTTDLFVLAGTPWLNTCVGNFLSYGGLECLPNFHLQVLRWTAHLYGAVPLRVVSNRSSPALFND